MLDAGIDLLFLPVSGDLEYLTGIPRREPSFGNVAYRHGWMAGAFNSEAGRPEQGKQDGSCSRIPPSNSISAGCTGSPIGPLDTHFKLYEGYVKVTLNGGRHFPSI